VSADPVVLDGAHLISVDARRLVHEIQEFLTATQ
jgi:hypothetical protein